MWIGLLSSIIILVESITGLLLAEPWLMGVEGREGRPPQAVMENQTMTTQPSSNQAVQAEPAAIHSEQGEHGMQANGRREQGGIMSVVHQLHEGRIGSMDAKWLVDVSAIAMIVLTITGITLSIKTLRAQNIRRKRSLIEDSKG